VDRDDVRVLERRDRVGLALEALPALGIRGGRGREDLEATSRASFVSVARYTSPMPPAPIFSTIL
jgi:hypothetical protein